VERRGEYVTVADALGDVVYEDMVKYVSMWLIGWCLD
jgi:hypothetical protein